MAKKIFLTVFLFLSLTLFGSWEFELSLNSRYIWRGFDLYNNNPAIQPSLTYSLGQSGLSLNLWGSFALKERSVYREADELDLTLNYELELKKITFSAGFIHYGYYFVPDFSFKKNTTQEVYFGLTFNDLPVEPRLKLYYDFNLGNGLFVEAGISREFKVSQKFGLNFDLWQGYNGGQFGVKSGFSDLNILCALRISTQKIVFRPFFWYCRIFNEEVNSSRNEILFGLRICFDL